MATGKVKWFSNQKGYGFIALDSGEDAFVHHTSIEGEGFKTLKEGEGVECEIEESPRGKQAKKVIKL